ncbi:MAG: outer membrane protein assembly factor BamC [Pseudomonadota bacterium]|nr:outer membrane protein assembly factor BamC [Pseudomonadota bacterium]
MDDYLPDQRLQYKKQREAEENLEVPPDLTAGTYDDALDVPDLGATGSATYSEYVGERKKRRQIASSGDVLPEVKDVSLRREGDSRWLEIENTPQQVWPRVVAFWREQGILLVEQDPSAGVMKTDWLENRAEIRQDFLTSTLRRVVDGLYATSTRDQYRVRIETGLTSGTTDLYLTHRSMEERFNRNPAGEDTHTIWEPSGSDPGKEGAMLRRLMVYLGVTEQRADRVLSQEKATAPKSRLVPGAAGQTALLIDDDYRRAWRLTGVALDRVGFAVEDRDRTQGVYYVRYDDPSKGEKKGFMSKLAFWRDENVDTVTQYRVKLTGEGDQTRVVVLDTAGRQDSSATGKRILTLLNEQIR